MPLVVGITTVLGTFLVLRAVNEVRDINVFALNLVIGLGLGLAIDYTLFLVTRFREEIAAGGPGEPAIRRTMATAGRTVAFSGVTVACALITLAVFPQQFLQSMGIAGAIVALVAAAAALVLSPALFALWGAKLARRTPPSDGGRWRRVAEAVMRRPGIVAAATAAAMLALALPALGTNWTPIDATAIPKGESSRTVADALVRDAGGAARAPVVIAVSAPAAAGDDVAPSPGGSRPSTASPASPRRAAWTRRPGRSTRSPTATRPARPRRTSSRRSGRRPRRSRSPSAAPRPSSSISRPRSAAGCRWPWCCCAG
jgi:RND superfamily putative drug exporter